MLVYKASQVIAAQAVQSKSYSFKDERGAQRDGTSIFSDMTVLSTGGSVAVIRLKGKTEEEVKAKIAKVTIGKAAEIQIRGMEESARGGVLILS